MKTLILNSSNIIDTNNGQFQFNFTTGSIKIEQGQKLALAKLQMYYSNFNVTSSYTNNIFSYTWIDGTTVSVTIPDSFLDIDGIKKYIQYTMLQNGHYYLSSGNYVYLMDLVVNASRYGVDIISYATSTTIATAKGWTIPTGTFNKPAWTNPSVSKCPLLIISLSNFGKLIGFETGSYPASQTITNTSYVSQSTKSPQIAPVASYIITCNLIKNNYTFPSNLLYSFTSDVKFGSQMDVSPNQFAFIECQPGSYNSFTLQIVDQEYQPVKFQDPNTVIMLIISDPNEKI